MSIYALACASLLGKDDKNRLFTFSLAVRPPVSNQQLRTRACHPSSTVGTCGFPTRPLTEDVSEDKKSEKEDPIALCVVIGATWRRPSAALMSGVSRQVRLAVGQRRQAAEGGAQLQRAHV